MKNLDGGFEVKNYVDKWFSTSSFITYLLHKSKLTEVISGLLFTFIAHKQEHLNFYNTFLYLLHNYDVTSLGNIHSITL